MSSIARSASLGASSSKFRSRPLKYSRTNSSVSAAADANATERDGATAQAQRDYQIVRDHGNSADTEAQRPDFDPAKHIEVTKSPCPEWKYGQGVPDNGASLAQIHHEIDPYAPDRPKINNYRLLISGIAPQPVGFLSTVGSNGQKNLSPFSYFQLIDHDPPMFIVGFYHGRTATVFGNMIEAVSATFIDAPYGVSEWDISGLREAPSTTVKLPRVQESVLNIEGRVIDIKEFTDHQRPGMSLAATVLIQATRFWVKEGTGTADPQYSYIDLDKLRPVGQLGGISYGRVVSSFERPRVKWDDGVPRSALLAKLQAARSE
ncbi:hypothetical protein BDW71DRAFT_211827 [Aspergillus fruticulosus]